MIHSLILGIDPGPRESAWVVLESFDADHPESDRVVAHGYDLNADITGLMYVNGGEFATVKSMACEMIEARGMSVDSSTFDTCVTVGRFLEAWERGYCGRTTERIYRRDVKLTICLDSRAKDTNIRQALINRWGGKEKAIGNSKAKGPLHGVSSHCWAALAVAVTHLEKLRAAEKGLKL